MNRLVKYIEKLLMPITIKMACNRYVSAIKNGLTYALPFLIVGSFLVVLMFLPIREQSSYIYIKWYDSLIKNYSSVILQSYYATAGILSLLVTFGVATSLSKYYNLNQNMGGILSIFYFILLAIPMSWTEAAAVMVGLNKGESALIGNCTQFGVTGVLIGFFTGIVSVEIYRLSIDKNWVFKTPLGVSSLVSKAFELIVPIMILLISFLPTLKIYNCLSKVVLIKVKTATLISLSDPSTVFWTMLIILIISHLFLFIGFHGTSIMIYIIAPILAKNLSLNYDNYVNNIEINNILAGGFLDQYVLFGGAGGTLGLMILFIFCKSQYLKMIGKLAFLPSFLNINEPIIYGAPIVLNPILFIPFVLTPVISFSIAWKMFEFRFVKMIIDSVSWTIPVPIAAYISASDAFANLLLVIILIMISMLIYWPFVKVYDNLMVMNEFENNK